MSKFSWLPGIALTKVKSQKEVGVSLGMGSHCIENYCPDLTKSFVRKSCCKLDKVSKFRLLFCLALTKVKSQKEVGVAWAWGVICIENYGPELTKCLFRKSCCKLDKVSKIRLLFSDAFTFKFICLKCC